MRDQSDCTEVSHRGLAGKGTRHTRNIMWARYQPYYSAPRDGGGTTQKEEPYVEHGKWEDRVKLAYELVKEVAEVDHDIYVGHQVEDDVDPLRSGPPKRVMA